MLDERDLQAIAQLMDKKLEPITARLDKLEAGQATIKKDLAALKADMETVKADLDQLKGDHKVTREALNHLGVWADKVSEAVTFPLPKT